MRQFKVYLNDDMKERLQSMANDKTNGNFSELVRLALTEYSSKN